MPKFGSNDQPLNEQEAANAGAYAYRKQYSPHPPMRWPIQLREAYRKAYRDATNANSEHTTGKPQ